MNIGIFYGGRGVLSDPTLYVLKKMTAVLEELNINVERYDLYDQKNTIATLPQNMKEMDGIILATTVEWHGIGGYMSTLLDACWLYGDKERISKIYMAPVVMSTTYGEKDAELELIKAWTTLGGRCADGITGYVSDITQFEQNEDYNTLIEKCAENIYRAISQKKMALPVSTREVSRKVNKTPTAFLTQQETEQLSEYISDEKYVSKQKEDIRALASLFKGKLDSTPKEEGGAFEKIIQALKDGFKPQPEVHAKYHIIIKDIDKSIAVIVDNTEISVKAGDIAEPDYKITLTSFVMQEIISGRKTFQGGFMEGDMSTRGEFKYIRILDEIFPFMK